MISQCIRWLLLITFVLALAFGLLVYWHPEVVHLDTTARRKNISARVRALVSKIKVVDNDEALIAELVGIAKSDYSFGAATAVGGMGELGDDGSKVVGTLGDLLFSSNGYVRRNAAYSLSKLGHRSASELPKLVNAIDSPAFDADYAAYEAIGEIGEAAVGQLPWLREKLSSSPAELNREELIETIAKLESIQRADKKQKRE